MFSEKISLLQKKLLLSGFDLPNFIWIFGNESGILFGETYHIILDIKDLDYYCNKENFILYDYHDPYPCFGDVHDNRFLEFGEIAVDLKNISLFPCDKLEKIKFLDAGPVDIRYIKDIKFPNLESFVVSGICDHGETILNLEYFPNLYMPKIRNIELRTIIMLNPLLILNKINETFKCNIEFLDTSDWTNRIEIKFKDGKRYV